MRKDLILNKKIYSPFLSVDRDIEKILKTLFITSRPYSDLLKRLLIINNKNCLDTTILQYQQIIDKYSLADLIQHGYIRLNPKIARGTHEEIKSYIILSLDSFSNNNVSNHYRDYIVHFDIVCYNDAWILDDYKIRPLAICGYIEGILNSLTNNNKGMLSKDYQSNIKLSGIGEYQFLGCNENVLNEDISMYTLSFAGTHFSDDIGEMNE